MVEDRKERVEGGVIDFKKLCEPFPPDRVSWRVGSTSGDKTRGLALGYIDARDVMQRLDEVVGPENWQCRYSHAENKTVCEIGILIPRHEDMPEWVWKADGAGDTDFEAEKGALSDAFKRAAVRWGIGRYLYDLPAEWVHIEPAGKSYRIKEHELKRLTAILQGQAPPPPPPTNSRDPSWKGEKTKTELKNAVRGIVQEIEACDDLDQLDVFLETPETKSILAILKHNIPDWWDHDEDETGFMGVKQRIARKRDELMAKEAA